MGGTGTGTNPPVRAVSETLRRLPPGSFAFVMATGIVSTAFRTIGWLTLSTVLLVIAVVALVLLAAAAVWQVLRHPGDVVREASAPNRAFQFFTLVAAINVVGVRLYSVDAPYVTIALGIISVPLWLLMTYGIPSLLILRRHETPVAQDVDGSWFLWVVGTQSLATVSAVIGNDLHSRSLAAISVAMWGIGMLLYLMLATLVTLRLLTVPSTAASFSPSYWIYMGATAITVLAGSRILALPADLPVMAIAGAVVAGMTYVLWGFGVWWVPLLVIFGIWRHVVHREPMRYETGLWSIVFPLGMYSVASMHFGSGGRLALMVHMGEVGTWIAGVAWLLVTAAMVNAAWRGWGRWRESHPGHWRRMGCSSS